MTSFKTLLLAAALGLTATAFSGGTPTALAASQSTKAAAHNKTPGKSAYAILHKQVLEGMNNFKDFLLDSGVQGTFTDVETQFAKLPGLEKSYVDARKADDSAKAQIAMTAYDQTFTTICTEAMPLYINIQQTGEQLDSDIASLGPIGLKIYKGADAVALQGQIDTLLKPFVDVVKLVGPIQNQAAKAASARIKLLVDNIQAQEYANAAGNYLQGKASE